MNSKRKYISPSLEITEFECEDVITVSGDKRNLWSSIDEKNNVPGAKAYTNAGRKKWSDIYQ